jgi:hypothetical protein
LDFPEPAAGRRGFAVTARIPAPRQDGESSVKAVAPASPS